MTSIQISLLILLCAIVISAASDHSKKQRAKRKPGKVLQMYVYKNYSLLTPIEQELYAILHTVQGNGEYNKVIKEVLDSDDPEKFRMLLRELKDQANDAPEATKNIIGMCAFRRLASYQ